MVSNIVLQSLITAGAGAAATYAVANGPRILSKLPGMSQVSRMTTDLTSQAPSLKRAYGREKEIAKLLGAINLPGVVVLYGKSGVGKTALIHHLAILAAEGETPSVANVRVAELNLVRAQGMGLQAAWNALLNGGIEAFFDKLLGELKSLSDSKKRTILFIDEIQELLNKNPNIFDRYKDRLTQEGITIVGATTDKEALSAVLNRGRDSQGLERRFQIIEIGELSSNATIEVLKQDRPRLTEKYQLSIEESVIEKCVHYAPRRFPSVANPDRAIKLLNEVLIFACNKEKKSCQISDFFEYVALVSDRTEEQIQAELGRVKLSNDLQRSFPSKFFQRANTMARGTAVGAIQEGAERLQNFFSQQEEKKEEKSGVILQGVSKCALNHVIDLFATFKKEVRIERCSLNSLGRLIEKEPSMCAKIAFHLDDLFSSEALLVIEDGEELVRGPIATQMAVAASAASMMPQGALGAFTDALEQGIKQLGALPSVPHREESGLLKAPKKLGPIKELFTRFIRERKANFIIVSKTMPGSPEIDTILIKDLELKDSEVWLEERFPHAKEGSNSSSLIRKVFIAAQSLSDSPLDFCCEFFEGLEPNAVIEDSFVVDELMRLTRGGKTREQIQTAWAEASIVDHPAFRKIEKDFPAIKGSGRLEERLTTFHGMQKGVLWVEESSDAYRDLLKQQAIGFLKSKGRDVVCLDLSQLQKLSLSEEQQIGFFESELEDFKTKANSVLVVEDKDLFLPAIRGKIQSLAGNCSLVVFATPRVTVSAQAKDEAPQTDVERVLEKGADVVQNLLGTKKKEQEMPLSPIQQGWDGIDLLKCSNVPFEPENALRFFLGQVLKSHNTAHDPKIMHAYARIYTELHKQGLTTTTLDPKVMQALAYIYGERYKQSQMAMDAFVRIYTELYKQGMEPQQVFINLKRDISYFEGQRKLASLQQNDVIKRLFDAFGDTFGLGHNDFKYMVDPQLTPRWFRVWHAVKTTAATVFGGVMVPLKFLWKYTSSALGWMAGVTMWGGVRRLLGF